MEKSTPSLKNLSTVFAKPTRIWLLGYYVHIELKLIKNEQLQCQKKKWYNLLRLVHYWFSDFPEAPFSARDPFVKYPANKVNKYLEKVVSAQRTKVKWLCEQQFCATFAALILKKRFRASCRAILIRCIFFWQYCYNFCHLWKRIIRPDSAPLS